jgi:hypothetical protein
MQEATTSIIYGNKKGVHAGGVCLRKEILKLIVNHKKTQPTL